MKKMRQPMRIRGEANQNRKERIRIEGIPMRIGKKANKN